MPWTKRQRRYFGAVASGRARRKGLPRRRARKLLEHK